MGETKNKIHFIQACSWVYVCVISFCACSVHLHHLELHQLWNCFMFWEMRINACMWLDRYWSLFMSHVLPLFCFFYHQFIGQVVPMVPLETDMLILAWGLLHVLYASTAPIHQTRLQQDIWHTFYYITQTAADSLSGLWITPLISQRCSKKEEKKCSTTAQCGTSAFMCVWIII